MIGEAIRRLRQPGGGDSRLAWAVTLAAAWLIIVAGGFLRLRGLDWDYPPGGESSHQHPDERFLSIVADNIDWPASTGEYFDTGNSPLNPYNVGEVNSFVYGTLPLYLGKGLTTIAGDDPEGPGNSYNSSVRWGRRLTATVSTASIALTFLAGLVLLGRGAALLGSLLYALSVLPTQLAHFWTVDPYVTFFALLTVLLSALLPRARAGPGLWALYGGIGIAIGLGMASKVAFWPLALVPVIETASRTGLRVPGLNLRREGTGGTTNEGDWLTDMAGLFFAAFVSLVVFRLAQPHAFTGPGLLDIGLNSRWWEDLRGEAERQSGASGLPWVIQFAGRPPYVESLKNMILWGMGPALGLASWCGLIAAFVTALRRRETAFAVPVLLPLVFLAYFGGRFVVFMRYFDPVYPLLCLLGAWGLLALLTAARRLRLPSAVLRTLPAARNLTRIAPAAAAGLAGAVIVLTLWWALAFQDVYTTEHTRIQASRWLYDHAAVGSAITNEVWDDALPMSLPGEPRADALFRLVPTEPYEPDSISKVSKLVYGDPQREDRPGLAGADYVVLSSDRVRLSVPRLERRYPATIRYYELLESGELGFRPAATFRVRPSFLGIAIDDSKAEESFSVYDHPTVRIYEKTETWDADRAFELLLAAYPDRAVNLTPGQGRTNGLQFTASEAAKQQSGGTFSDVFEGGLGGHWPAFWWLVWLELAGLAAVPFVAVLCHHLPDRGLPLTKAAGPIVVALIVWLLVAWDLFDFSGTLAWTVFALWLTAGAAGLVGSRRLREDLRKRWRVWVAGELLFVVVFAAFLLLRAWNPDIWHHPQGGEKPMELAYLTAVARSTEMPPYDPWFAGGSMNYYYWGWFLLSVPVRALRVLPEVAFNLGIPTFAAMAAAVAFSIAGNLVALTAGARRRTREVLAGGFVGAFLLVVAGNLDGIHQTVERLQRTNTWELLQGKPVLGGAVGLLGGLARYATGADLPPYDWWRSSRVHIGSFDITEFPYWSFTFADLHPHLMGLPFFGLVLALALALLVSAQKGDLRRSLALAGAAGLAVGLVRAVHTWDYPTALLISFAGMAGGQLLAPGRAARGLATLGAQGLVFGFLLLVPLAPYYAHTEVFNQGLGQAPETTPLYQFFAQFGVFTVVALVYLVTAYLRESRSGAGRERRRRTWIPLRPGPPEALAIVGSALILGALAWQPGYATVAEIGLLELLLLNLLALQWGRRAEELGGLVTTALFAGGFAIVAGMDLVTVDGDIVRMNTVFKFSLQAWQMFAAASGFAVWYVIRTLPSLPATPGLRRAVRMSVWTGAGLLAAVSCIYAVSGTPARLAARFPHDTRGLDGLAYLDVARYHEDAGTSSPDDDRDLVLGNDRPLIDWLRANVDGSPVIAEAVGPLYHWTGRIAMNTGLPAVIGWDWHQVQQRGSYAGLISQRRSDTARFFRETNVGWLESYLRKYNVRYVVIGTEELVYGTPEARARMAESPAVSEVFREGEYAIYRVDQELLPPPVLPLLR